MNKYFSFHYYMIEGQTVNLPNKVTIPENTETGVTIFTIEGDQTGFDRISPPISRGHFRSFRIRR